MKYTCAVIYTDGTKFLACHPTGKIKNQSYSLPKGISELNEDWKNAAVRELYEETSLSIDKNKLKYLGVFKHSIDKHLVLFLYKTNILPNISSLKCLSKFEFNGKMIDEVDGYAYLNISTLNLLDRKTLPIIDQVKNLVFT